MNKALPRVIALLVLLILAIGVPFAGCDNSQGPNDPNESESTPPQTPAEFSLVENGEPTFILVRSKEATAAEKAALSTLATGLEQLTDITFSQTNDQKGGYDSTRAEILIGNTHRPQTETTTASLSSRDFTVRVIDNKIVIWGGSDDFLEQAVSHFLQEAVSKSQGSFTVSMAYSHVSKAPGKYMDDSKLYTAKSTTVPTHNQNKDKNYIHFNNGLFQLRHPLCRRRHRDRL